MNQIAEVNPQTVEAMKMVMAIRFDQFGEEVLAVLKKGRVL
jgi:hypothetical protein